MALPKQGRCAPEAYRQRVRGSKAGAVHLLRGSTPANSAASRSNASYGPGVSYGVVDYLTLMAFFASPDWPSGLVTVNKIWLPEAASSTNNSTWMVPPAARPSAPGVTR